LDECNGERRSIIHKDNQKDNKIHFYIEVLGDGQKLGQSVDVIGGNFQIQFSGRWH